MKAQTFRDFLERLSFPFWRECGTPCSVLKDLIREVESCAGYARNAARTKAKTWLTSHGSSLSEEHISLAKIHFGYLLPAEWGLKPKLQQSCAGPESTKKTHRVKTP
jgi:hypothetical protein